MNTLTRSTAILALLVLFLVGAMGSVPSRAETPVPEVLGEETHILLHFGDFPEFLEGWEESPAGELWRDPELKRFLAPLLDKWEVGEWEEKVREETGYPLSEIMAQFRGQLAIVLPDIAEFENYTADEEAEEDAEEIEDMEDDENEEEWDLRGPYAILATVGKGTEVIESLLDQLLTIQRDELESGQEIRAFEEELQGETLHLREMIDEEGIQERNGWAIVDGMAIFAGNHAILRELVSAWKSGSRAGSLAELEAFVAIEEDHPDQDFLAYFNVSAMYDMIVAAAMEEAAERQEENPNAPAPDKMFEALALDAIHCAYFTGRESEDESSAHFGIRYSENRGLMKALAYLPGPVPHLPFLDADLLSFSVTNFSINEFYLALREIFATFDPSAGPMIDMQIRNLNAVTGIDLEKEIIGSLGNVVFSTLSPPISGTAHSSTPIPEMDQVFGLEVADAQSLGMALETLLGVFATGVELFEEQEFMGTTIHALKQPMPSEVEGGPPRQMSYALTGDYLLIGIGSSGTLRPLLSAMAREGKSVWDDREAMKSLSLASDEASMISYANMRLYIRFWHQIMSQVGDNETMSISEYVDLDHLPDPDRLAEFFGPALSFGMKDDRTFITTTRMLRP